MPLLSVGYERTLRGNPPTAAIDPIADFGVMYLSSDMSMGYSLSPGQG
jgi:hypothetical protein